MRKTCLSALLPPSLATILLLAGAACAQSQNPDIFYMQVSTSHGVIAGDSTDAAHPGWIVLRSLGYVTRGGGKSGTQAAKAPRDVASGQASGKRQHDPFMAPDERHTTAEMNSAGAATQTSTGASSGSRGSFPSHGSEIIVTKITDKSSPQLLKAETSGEHLPQVVIEVYRGGVRTERLVLKDVMVSSYKAAPHAAEAVPAETVTFQAARIEKQ